jgi:phenylalanyl-tRNA synthetase beta chain
MKIPLSWLKEYIDVKLTPQALAHRLTMAGLEVSHIQKAGKDTVLELELTTNRVDCASVIGIARELAALLDKPLRVPIINDKDKREKGILRVEIKDRKGCSFYSGRLIRNVQVKSSPPWLKKHLKSMGVKSINNVVDVTNYVLFELGQPLHAFDLDKIEGQKIVVRRAKKGEKITTIDGKERILDEGILVIADEKRPVALAGIMGGEDTEVNKETKNILLESAYFDPIVIRKAAKQVNLFTESSYRFERDLDPEGALTASRRARDLILKVAGGEEMAFTDKNYLTRQRKKILLRKERVNLILGTRLSWGQMTTILKKLGFEVKGRTVTVPSYRRDVKREIDVIEEIAHIYGYNAISSNLPRGIAHYPPDPLAALVSRAREVLAASNLREVVNYGFIASEEAQDMGFDPLGFVRLANPMTAKQNIMRPAIIPGLLGNLAHNLNQGNPVVKVFELGHIFLGKREEMALGALIAGEEDFYRLKGILEAFCRELNAIPLKIIPGSLALFRPGRGGEILIAGKKMGFIGEVDPGVLSHYGIEKEAFVFEINFQKLLLVISQKRFKRLPRYPAIVRDIALVVREEVTSEAIIQIILSIGKGLVEEVNFFDLYRGSQIPAGHKGLAYSVLYRVANRTLRDAEIDKIHQRISSELEETLGASIRK